METEVLRDSSEKRSRAEPIDEIEVTAIAEAMLGLGPATRTSSPDGSEEQKEAKPEKAEEEWKAKAKAKPQPKKKRKVSKVRMRPFLANSPSYSLLIGQPVFRRMGQKVMPLRMKMMSLRMIFYFLQWSVKIVGVGIMKTKSSCATSATRDGIYFVYRPHWRKSPKGTGCVRTVRLRSVGTVDRESR